MKRRESSPPDVGSPMSAKPPGSSKARRQPPSLSIASPERSTPTPDGPLKDYIDAKFKDIYGKLADITSDHLKLHGNVEDQLTEIRKLPKQKDIHEASGKVMEDCEKLFKKANDRISLTVGQIEQALLLTAAVDNQLELHVKGAFKAAETNFEILKQRVDELANKDNEETASADAKETDVHLRASLRRLERRLDTLETAEKTPPKEASQSSQEKPEQESKDNDSKDDEISNLLREFGNMKADVRDLKLGKQAGGTKTAGSGNCHCIHVDELQVIVEELEQRLDKMVEDIKNLKKANGRAPLIPPRDPEGEAQQEPERPPNRWTANAKAPEFHPQGYQEQPGDGPEDYPMWSYTDELHYNKIFDDKVALNQEYQFGTNGSEDGEKWRLQVRGYWIARIPFMMAILDWVEKNESIPITRNSIEQAAHLMKWPQHVDY